MKYVVQGDLAKLNEHDNANRANRFGGAKLKKTMTDLVAIQMKRKRKIMHPCTIEFVWYYSGKHDFDNIRFSCKYVLDGMVKAGILHNDNQKWVLGFVGDEFIKVKKGQEKVEVIAYEFEV